MFGGREKAMIEDQQDAVVERFKRIELETEAGAKSTVRSRSNVSTQPTIESVKSPISTEQAVRLLSEGEPGVSAWNQLRREKVGVPSLANVDLSGRDLRHADLTSLDMRGANLKSARLAHAKCMDSDFSGAILDELNVYGCDFSRSIFREASMKEIDGYGSEKFCTLAGSCLDGANLTGSDLRNAEIDKATVRDAILDSADLRGATGEVRFYLAKSRSGARLPISRH